MLNVREGCLPIRQKKRGQAPERNKAISEEVKKLVEAGIIKEVHYHSWLSNPVMKVESLCGYPYKCFMDAYKGYHKIKMAKEDEEKTAFIISQGIFYYSKMPFGLKNAGATYQRLVDKVFQKQIGRNLECTKKSDFQWTLEAEGAFKEMKQSIAELPMLMAPKEKEELIMYLAAAKEALSAVLMTERYGKQVPVYFVSHALQGPEINYTLMEKLILTIVSARMEFTYALRFRFNATNNEAEYEALIAGLRIARQMGVQNLQANVDSKLAANQVNRIYIAKESSMIRYLEKVKNLANTFKEFSIKQIPRGENKKADALSKITSTSFAHLSKQVLVEELREKAIDEKEILAVVEEEGHTWMTLVYEYLMEGILPEEKKKAKTVRRKAGRYAVTNEVLYKKSFLGPRLQCVGPLQANYVLREIHEGSCSMHAGPRIMVAEALRSCYFWPTMHTDARNSIRECKDCQVHRPVPRNPQEKLSPITSPWPFYKWGIDIAGPFPEGPGKVKFLIVAMDYFTKWIEARPVATITGTQVKKFVWDNIECRFGLPGLIPAKIGMPTLRTAEVDMVKNNEALGISLDLLEEEREQAAIQEARNKAKMKGYYNARVRSTNFRPGDFVYQSNEASHAEDEGKLGPKWEGPYEVTEALGKRAYRLRDRNGHTLPRTWNICNLKKCYMHEM
nr:reverse transcriptase domain-containing protein [Tanacetum cinerariifolium]